MSTSFDDQQIHWDGFLPPNVRRIINRALFKPPPPPRVFKRARQLAQRVGQPFTFIRRDRFSSALSVR